MKKVKTIGCVIKPHAPNVTDALLRLIGYLEQKGINYLLGPFNGKSGYDDIAFFIIRIKDNIPELIIGILLILMKPVAVG